jgi:hypothetical protein
LRQARDHSPIVGGVPATLRHFARPSNAEEGCDEGSEGEIKALATARGLTQAPLNRNA